VFIEFSNEWKSTTLAARLHSDVFVITCLLISKKSEFTAHEQGIVAFTSP
jgi:hypothetical protein